MNSINDAAFTRHILYDMLHSINLDSLKPEFRDECLRLELPVKLYRGIVGSQEKSEQIKSLATLIGKTDADEAFFLGLQLLFSLDESESLKWLEMASDLGKSDASYALAMGYSFGSGVGIVKKSDDKKLKLYLDLALAQNPDNAGALNFLGMMRMGEFDGLPADMQFSFECFNKSAELGNPTALFNLSTFYYDGIIVDEDVDKALDLLKQAADAGEGMAIEALAILYQGNDKVPYDEDEFHHWSNVANFGELDTDPAHVKEFEETREHAEHGDPEAQFKMYCYYGICRDSQVVYPDSEKEHYWLAHAAANNYPSALRTISIFQMSSDPVSAVANLRKGAELGDERCMKELSEVLFKGKRPYVSQNTKEAVYWGEKYVDLAGGIVFGLQNYYIKRKKWDKYLDYEIKRANRQLEYIHRKELELGDGFDAWAAKEQLHPYHQIKDVGKYFFDGGASYPEGFVVEQSYAKALEWFNQIPERFQHDDVKEYIRICKTKLEGK